MWDTFTGHMTEEVQDELRKKNITVAMIPGGCTCKIQPLDVCLNKPFKCHCRAQWFTTTAWQSHQDSVKTTNSRLGRSVKQSTRF